MTVFTLLKSKCNIGNICVLNSVDEKTKKKLGQLHSEASVRSLHFYWLNSSNKKSLRHLSNTQINFWKNDKKGKSKIYNSLGFSPKSI